MEKQRRIRLRLEFDGSFFCGWQLQAEDHEAQHLPSVQSQIEKGLSTLLHLPAGTRVPVQGSGRTDAGVHAEEYFCHFDWPLDEAPTLERLERLRHGLNSTLVEGLAVTHCEEVPPDFHALESLEHKTYEYRVLLRRARPTLQRGRCLWMPVSPAWLRWDLLEAALAQVQGEHDFAAFRAAHSSAKTTRREILSATYRREALGKDAAAGEILRLQFCGRGFLKHMVRNLTGTLLEIATEKRELSTLKALLGEQGAAGPLDRSAAGFCAPPEGLFLIQLRYR